jgi:hypothetical protein
MILLISASWVPNITGVSHEQQWIFAFLMEVQLHGAKYLIHNFGHFQ